MDKDNENINEEHFPSRKQKYLEVMQMDEWKVLPKYLSLRKDYHNTHTTYEVYEKKGTQD